MSQSWSDIVAFYRDLPRKEEGEPTWQAIRGIEALAQHIEQSPRLSRLQGWTSMLDLCIRQTGEAPYAGPFLRVSPLSSGKVEFRYLDTSIAARQWHREVPSAETIARFLRFLDQLRWFGGSSVVE
ncbi:MAG TPA: hypothetical protein VG328_25635 [Stellaceae bacterium]|jgi:hypothetical protein|nr:hypothetical protein [Stellaceae bacterium]